MLRARDGIGLRVCVCASACSVFMRYLCMQLYNDTFFSNVCVYTTAHVNESLSVCVRVRVYFGLYWVIQHMI